MLDLTTFILLTGLAALATVITIITVKSAATAVRLSHAFYLYTVAISAAALVVTTVRSIGLARLSALTGLPFQILIYRGWLVIGAAVGAVVMIAIRGATRAQATPARDAVRAFVSSPYLLRALCFSVTCSFLAVEIGKLAHDADMRQFFLQSGLPVWVHYAVMVLETLGALALFVSTLRLPAAAGLSLLMIGAIGTHARNGDPFTDSLEALHLLILLTCIIVLSRTVTARPGTLAPR